MEIINQNLDTRKEAALVKSTPSEACIDWLILKNDVTTDPIHGDCLNLVAQGVDRPQLIMEFTRPFAETRLNIHDIRYGVFGADRKYYNLEIVARDARDKISHVRDYFARHRVQFAEIEKCAESPGFVRVDHPYLLKVQFAVADAPGVAAKVANLVGVETPPTVQLDFSLPKRTAPPVIANGSFTRFRGCRRASHLVGYQCEQVNDLGLAEGGVGGFEIKAEVAAASEGVLVEISQRLQNFLKSVECFRENYSLQHLGASRLAPVHFRPTSRMVLN